MDSKLIVSHLAILLLKEEQAVFVWTSRLASRRALEGVESLSGKSARGLIRWSVRDSVLFINA